MADLHAMILTGLPHALAEALASTDLRFAPFVEEMAQETALYVLAHLDSFEGHSRFTTWVYKFAVHLAFAELRRRRAALPAEKTPEDNVDEIAPRSVTSTEPK